MQQTINSCIGLGHVRHRRHTPTDHRFSYPLYMLRLDLDELELLNKTHWSFGVNRFAPLSFYRKDYLDDKETPLKQAVIEKSEALGADKNVIDRVEMVGQARCFGWYFSPVNFYFCYQKDQCRYMLAEVRNTPWYQRHCYLVDLDNPEPSEKDFHVSPFMDMAMKYHWHIKQTPEKALIHIENRRDQGERVFDASLQLAYQPFSKSVLKAALLQWPMMTFTVMKGIYWQAFKLWRKAVPYQPHPNT